MSTSPTDRHQRILDDLTAVLAPHGVIVEDLTVTPAGKRRLVRILVDRDVHSDLNALPADDETSKVEPLDLDTVGELTRVISDELDATDAMGEQPYVLEVSSPGVDRPMTLPRHFRRNVTRSVTVTTAEEEITGRLVRAGQHDFEVRTEGAKGAVADRTLRYDEVEKAKVNVEFNRAEEGEH